MIGLNRENLRHSQVSDPSCLKYRKLKKITKIFQAKM